MIIKRSLVPLLGIFFFFASICIVPFHTYAQATTETPASSPAVETPASSPAANTTGCAGNTICNPLKVATLKDLLDLVLNAAIDIGGIILTLAIIWTGFLFVAARGAPEKISAARTALIWTLIGGLILLGAKGIEAVVLSTTASLSS